MLGRRYTFYIICGVLVLVSLSIHVYFPGINPLNVQCKKIHGSSNTVLVLPKALNYIPSNEELETVIRKDLDTFPIMDIPIPHDENNSKLILFYTRLNGGEFIDKSWNWTSDGTFHYPDSLAKCPRKCKATLDKSLVEEAHAIVFSFLDTLYNRRQGEPRYPQLKSRNQNQIWVATSVETPLYHNANSLGKLGHLFNWTLTNRLDSDVYLPYGYFHKLESPKLPTEILLPDFESLRTKKLAVALKSNCGARSGRDVVIRSMEKYVVVDSFGRCGVKCPVSECRQFLGAHYKFFLAFENSLCQDYITEKFFDAFAVGMVPVTFGLGDYAEVAPAGSYINALDFPTVKALTNYLIHLDRNDEDYLKYFHWKLDYELISVRFQDAFCSLCLKLWEPLRFTQEITNVNDWWNHKRIPTLSSNSTIGERLLLQSKQGCVLPKEIFEQGYLT